MVKRIASFSLWFEMLYIPSTYTYFIWRCLSMPLLAVSLTRTYMLSGSTLCIHNRHERCEAVRMQFNAMTRLELLLLAAYTMCNFEKRAIRRYGYLFEPASSVYVKGVSINWVDELLRTCIYVLPPSCIWTFQIWGFILNIFENYYFRFFFTHEPAILTRS